MEIQSPGPVTACGVSFHLYLWFSTWLHRGPRVRGGALGANSRDGLRQCQLLKQTDTHPPPPAKNYDLTQQTFIFYYVKSQMDSFDWQAAFHTILWGPQFLPAFDSAHLSASESSAFSLQMGQHFTGQAWICPITSTPIHWLELTYSQRRLGNVVSSVTWLHLPAKGAGKCSLALLQEEEE